MMIIKCINEFYYNNIYLLNEYFTALFTYENAKKYYSKSLIILFYINFKIIIFYIINNNDNYK